ncbi:MAG TPA: hypothetical protein VFL75_02590 [Candidatus Limnocylindria bacterium]|nr:hypothetical protein [Candidatus Limnocylindria bacterium]
MQRPIGDRHRQARARDRLQRRIGPGNRRRPRSLLPGDGEGRRSPKRRRAGEHLVQDGAQPPQVRPRADLVARQLLRRHVARRAERRTGAGERLAGELQGAGDPKIDEARVAAGCLDQDVRRLHVAMDDSSLVGMEQCLGDLSRDARGLGRGHRTLACQPRGQRFPVDQLHDDRGVLVGAGDVVDGRDGRVRQRGRGPRLGGQPATGCLVGKQVRVEQLDGHRPAELDVPAAPDAGRSACGELFVEAVAAKHQHRHGGHRAAVMRNPPVGRRLHDAC